jgi:hypothetical protein
VQQATGAGRQKYKYRHTGIIASAGPFEAWGASIDGSVPLIGDALTLPIGVSTQVSTRSSEDGGFYPGLTSRVTSVGATPQWRSTCAWGRGPWGRSSGSLARQGPPAAHNGVMIYPDGG